MFLIHEVSTLIISTELHAADSVASQISLVINCSLSLSLPPPLSLSSKERKATLTSIRKDWETFYGCIQ